MQQVLLRAGLLPAMALLAAVVLAAGIGCRDVQTGQPPDIGATVEAEEQAARKATREASAFELVRGLERRADGRTHDCA